MRNVLVVSLAALGALLAGCGGKPAKPSAVGVYHLVKDQALLDGVKSIQLHDEATATPEQLAQMQQVIDGMDLTLTLKADNAFEVVGRMGGKIQASGTWKLAGQDLTITATHEDGKPRDVPEVTVLLFEGDTIRKTKDPTSQPFEMVLRRE